MLEFDFLVVVNYGVGTFAVIRLGRSNVFYVNNFCCHCDDDRLSHVGRFHTNADRKFYKKKAQEQ